MRLSWFQIREAPDRCRRLLAASSVLVIASCATAELEPQTTAGAFKADANADRQVTCHEWRSWLETSFSANDADGNGVWNDAEYSQFVTKAGMFRSVPLSTVDANADGQYTREELNAFGSGAFNARDVNGDCVLSDSELDFPELRQAETRPGPGGPVRTDLPRAGNVPSANDTRTQGGY